MDNREQVKQLLEKYIEGSATSTERQWLFNMLDQESDFSEWEALLQELAEQQPKDPVYQADLWEVMIQNILHHQQEHKAVSGRLKRLFTLRRVAIIALLIGAGMAFWLIRQGKQAPDAKPVAQTTSQYKNDVPPGGNKAILTLANGSTIILDNAQNGALAQQGNVKVIKLSNGQLAYKGIHAKGQGSKTALYNTITTPRGGQYQIILPDSSKVWLNAASSLRFPAAFTGAERQVELKGEAYFEIAGSASIPFKVKTDNMETTVLGTHFNIMSYDDEPAAKTTLLEGAVSVTNKYDRILLQPGQEASIAYNASAIKVTDADIEEAVAWKNGLFEFTSAGVEDIMRQIARWYEVDIVYPGGIPAGHITGKIPRNTNLSKVLEMMELSGVHFKVEGRKVMVLPS